MTTIAYHHGDGQIAVDSQTTSGGVICSSSEDKTIKNKYGLWVFAGQCSDQEQLSNLEHDDQVSVFPDSEALLIKESKVYHVCVTKDKFCAHTLLDYNYTLGSGGLFALTAMDFGKSAKEAVKYAMTRDIYTGGRVRVFNVGSK